MKNNQFILFLVFSLIMIFSCTRERTSKIVETTQYSNEKDMEIISSITQEEKRPQYDNEEDFIFEPLEDGNSVRIIQYAGKNTEVHIPLEINGLPVTHIGEEAFYRSKLTSVSISSYITHIEKNAFSNNELTNIVLPESIMYLGHWAFSDNKLTGVMFTSLIDIGFGVFANNQITDVILPDNMTVIPNEMFKDNLITNISIPASVKTIAPEAFMSNKITNIIIPDNVRLIGEMAFSGNNLSSITIGADVEVYGKHGNDGAFGNYGGFYDYYKAQNRRSGTYIFNKIEYSFNNGEWSIVDPPVKND